MKKPRIVDAMEYVDGDLITEAVSYRPKRNRIPTAVKWFAAAACLAVALLSAILYFPRSNGITPDSEQVIIPENVDVSDHFGNKENQNIDWNSPPINDGEVWGKMYSSGLVDSGEDGQNDLSVKPNLEGFQYAKNPDSYEAPPNGAYIMTDSLKAAVEKYGNQVTYRIHLAIYKDQNKLDSNSTEVQKWFNELNPKNIIITYSDFYDGSTHSYNFYMDACSYENLIAFCNIESEFGFILSLYRESNGDFSEQQQISPQIFNTPDIVD